MITLLLLAGLVVLLAASVRPMADMVRNTPRDFQGASPSGSIEAQAMPANLEVFDGSALMHNASTGALAKCTPTASGKFAGFAIEHVDNRTGSPLGGTLGSTTCQVQRRGKIWLTVASGSTWARTMVGDTVYAFDDDTFTLSAGTNNILIGKVAMVPESAVGAASARVLVAFEATPERSI